MLRFFGLEEAFPPYTFQGVRRDVRISALEGWRMFFCEPWSHHFKSSDFQLPVGVQGNALLVASRKKDSDVLEVAAMGLIDVVTKETESKTLATSHNGAFWYRVAKAHGN